MHLQPHRKRRGHYRAQLLPSSVGAGALPGIPMKPSSTAKKTVHRSASTTAPVIPFVEMRAALYDDAIALALRHLTPGQRKQYLAALRLRVRREARHWIKRAA